MAHLLPTRLLAYQLSGPQTAYNSPTNGTQAVTNMEKIISQVIGVMTVVAVIFLAFQIILAGYAFISAEGDKNKMETARKRLTEGVLGIVIVVVSVAFASLIARLAGLSPNIFDLNTLNIWAPAANSRAIPQL